MTGGVAPSPARAATRRWLADLLEAEAFSLEHMPLAASRSWALRGGAIRHESGRFFSVVGVRAVTAAGEAVEQPLLEQREIGTLAFLAREGRDGAELLVQAKVEPGNVGIIQLAPTFQATHSNADRVHGGAPPPLHGWIAGHPVGRTIADTLQSEQGTRFLGKRNRNCTIRVAGEVSHGPHHRWLPVRDVCALLGEDHLCNTDLRSTLVCAPWDLLTGGAAFGGGGFAAELRASLDLPDALAWQPLFVAIAALETPAAWCEAPFIVPLDDLAGWQLGPEGPEPVAGGAFLLRHIEVHATSREVAEWDQPIVESAGPGKVILPVGRWRGVPHFLFRLVCEPGFASRAEFTPALTVTPGEEPAVPELAELLGEGREIAACLQSEEGGRFLRDENRYALRDVGDLAPVPASHAWLSLAQIRALLDRGESLTNESRSAISLLLRWL